MTASPDSADDPVEAVNGEGTDAAAAPAAKKARARKAPARKPAASTAKTTATAKSPAARTAAAKKAAATTATTKAAAAKRTAAAQSEKTAAVKKAASTSVAAKATTKTAAAKTASTKTAAAKTAAAKTAAAKSTAAEATASKTSTAKSATTKTTTAKTTAAKTATKATTARTTAAKSTTTTRTSAKATAAAATAADAKPAAKTAASKTAASKAPSSTTKPAAKRPAKSAGPAKSKPIALLPVDDSTDRPQAAAHSAPDLAEARPPRNTDDAAQTAAVLTVTHPVTEESAPEESAPAETASEASETAETASAVTAAATDIAPGAADAIRIRGLVKRFGDQRAVDGIDLTVPAGSFYGLVGPNGAGKTTTLSIIAGLLRPDEGTVHISGIDQRAKPLAAKRMMGVLPDRLRTFDRLTGRQLLHYYGQLRGLERAVIEKRTADLARAFDLTEALSRVVSDYSAGMTKKVMLAGALIHSPRVLVLDEPFEAVDPVSSGVILDILRSYVAHGGTVILSSHGMDLVERVCTRVAVIVGGEVLAEGTIDEVRAGQTLEARFVELSGTGGEVEGLEWLHTFSD